MKRLLSLFAIALYLGGGVAYAAYDEGAFAHHLEEKDGPASEPVRVYTLVRYPDRGANSTQTAVSNGDVVVWDIVSDDGVTVNLIGAGGQAVSNDAVAGVAVGSIPTPDVAGNTAVQDLAKKNWGYIQVYGLHPTVKLDGSTIIAGNGLQASDTTRRAKVVAGVGGASLGFAYDASSATSEGAEVFIRTR